jgi:hypothetical protein
MNVVILLNDRYSLLNTRLSNSSGILEFQNLLQVFHLPFHKTTCTINIKEMKSQLTSEEVFTLNNIQYILVDAVLFVKSTYEVQILFSLLSTFLVLQSDHSFGCVLYMVTVEQTVQASVSIEY